MRFQNSAAILLLATASASSDGGPTTFQQMTRDYPHRYRTAEDGGASASSSAAAAPQRRHPQTSAEEYDDLERTLEGWTQWEKNWPEPVCLVDQPGTDVNVTYSDEYDTYEPAHCGIHCRHFHAEAASDDECPSDDGEGWYLDFVLDGEGRHVHVTSCPYDEILDFTLTPGSALDAPDYLTDAERDFLRKTAERIENDHDEVLDNLDALAMHAVRAAHILIEWPKDLPIQYVLDPQDQRDKQRDYELEQPQYLPTNPPQFTIRNRARKLSKSERKVPNEGEGPYRRLDHDDDPLFTDLCHEVFEFLHPVGYGNDQFSAQLGPVPYCVNDTGSKGMYIYDWTAPSDEETDDDRWSCQTREDMAAGCCYPPRIDFALGDCFGRCGMGCGSERTLGGLTLDCADLDFCRLFRVGTDDDNDGDVDATCHERFLNAIDDWMWSYNCDPEHQCPVNPWDCDYERQTLDDLWGRIGDLPPVDLSPSLQNATATTTTTTAAATTPEAPPSGEWSENLLPDGGFEQSASSSPWESFGRNGFTLAAGEGRNSGNAARITDGAAAQMLIDVTGNVPAGSRIRARGWSKASPEVSTGLASGNYALYFDVFYLNPPQGEPVATYGQIADFTPSTSWNKETLEITVGMDVESVSFYVFYKDDAESGGEVWFDDLALQVKAP